MFYYLYQITNLVNNKIYVGVHKTKDINDGYMGSGKVIKRAIDKHGIDNFKKDILEFFDTPEDMYAKEKEVVADDFLLREDVYNIRRGGYGGFDYINKNRTPEDWSMLGRMGSAKSPKNKGIERTYSWRKALSESLSGRVGGFIEKSHTDATKAKMRDSAIGKHNGYKNSQYGTVWVTNGIENKKIKKDDPIPEGWNKGRKIK